MDSITTSVKGSILPQHRPSRKPTAENEIRAGHARKDPAKHQGPDVFGSANVEGNLFDHGDEVFDYSFNE
jgi:hypothetical protein